MEGIHDLIYSEWSLLICDGISGKGYLVSPEPEDKRCSRGKPSEGTGPSTEGRTQSSPVLNMDKNNKGYIESNSRELKAVIFHDFLVASVETCGKVQRLVFHYGVHLPYCLCPIC